MRHTTDTRGESFWDLFTFLDGQVNISFTKPGEKRGFHLHKKKTDSWRLLQGTQLVVLLYPFTDDDDTLTISSDDKVIIMEAGDSLEIEPGIWHGYQNIGKEVSIMVYHETNKSGVDRDDDYEMPLETYTEWQ